MPLTVSSPSLHHAGHLPNANLRDIIGSKKASNRKKDLVDMELLEEFAREYAAVNAQPLQSTFEKAMQQHKSDPPPTA